MYLIIHFILFWILYSSINPITVSHAFILATTITALCWMSCIADDVYQIRKEFQNKNKKDGN